MDRRAAMASMAAALGATLLEFTGALRHSNIGERMLAYIEADAARFATQYATVGPNELLSPVQRRSRWSRSTWAVTSPSSIGGVCAVPPRSWPPWLA